MQLFSSSVLRTPSPNGEGKRKENLFELGREAPLQYHTTQQGSGTVLTIDRGVLESGMYFLSITSKEKREVVKVMAE